MNVDAWHDVGHRGAGVSIAVFDIQWFGHELNPYLADLPTHDCFGHRSCSLPIDTVNPQFAFETGGHGIACAEVIRAIAPDAVRALEDDAGRSFEEVIQKALPV